MSCVAVITQRSLNVVWSAKLPIAQWWCTICSCDTYLV